MGAKQVYYQCLLDEMKPLFGVPKLGTHCIYTDGFLDKIDKKLEWNPDNVTISDEHGCHVVMFPATALGFFPSQEGGTNEKGEDVVVEVPAEIPDQLDGFTVDVLTTPFVKKTRAPFLTTDFTSIRHQVMNIYMFYLCMGVSKGSLTNMFLKSVTGNTIDLRTEGAKGAEGSKGSDPEGEEGETNHPGGTAPSDEDMQEAMNAMVVPFYELTAFTNLSFPEIFKRLRQPLLQQLIINDQKYFMLRFFDLLMFLNFDAMETILQKFGAPVGEYISTIRNNLRDVRCGWLLYSQHAQDAIEETKQKAQEKNRIRNETKKAEAALLADAKDEKTTKKVTKKRTKPTAATAAKEDPVEDGESNEEQAVEVEDPSGEVEDPEETKPKKKSVKKAKTTSSTTKDEKVEKAPVAATKKASETKKVEKVTKVTKVTNVTKAVDKVKTNVNAEAPKKKKPVEKRDLDTDNAVPPSAPKKTKVVASKK